MNVALILIGVEGIWTFKPHTQHYPKSVYPRGVGVDLGPEGESSGA